MVDKQQFLSLSSRGLAYWRVIEAFTPQGLPKLKNKGLPRVVTWKIAQPGAWDSTSQFAKEQVRFKKEPFQHTVFAGLYRVSGLLNALNTFFPPDKTVFQDRSDTQSAICKFLIDDTGAPVVGSFVLSSAVWSVGVLLKANDPALVDNVEWVNWFDKAHDECKHNFDKWAGSWHDTHRHGDGHETPLAPKTPRAIMGSEIEEMLRTLVVELGSLPLVASLSAPDTPVIEYRVSTGKQPKSSSATEQDDTFMNSFFLSDLEKVRRACIRNDVGVALKNYLMPDLSPGDGKCDVRNPASLPILVEMLAPARFPIGAWPGKNKHPLVFSQQIAVNEMYHRLFGGAGLFAVNGPPGTGKTTLLRDVIAMVIVERARLIADGVPFFSGLPAPAWEIGRFSSSVAPVDQRFHGFEMVVASSNNGAVENVTMEIPGLEAVDRSWLEGDDNPDYFSDLASAILTTKSTEIEGDSDENKQVKTWGMLAAPLGNSTNRSSFSWNFWLQKQPVAKQGPSSTTVVDSEEKVANTPPKSFQILLNEPGGFPDFTTTLKRFRKACDQEAKIRAEVVAAHAAYAKISIAEKELAKAIEHLEVVRAEARSVAEGDHPQVLSLLDAKAVADEHVTEIMGAHRDAKADYNRATENAALSNEKAVVRVGVCSSHLRQAPSWWLVLLSFGKVRRNWYRVKLKLEAAELRARIRNNSDKEIAKNLLAEMGRVEKALLASKQTAKNAAAELTKFRNKIAKQLAEAEASYQKTTEKLRMLRATVDNFSATYSDHYPDMVVFAQDEAAREKSALWLIPEWYEARCRVFLAAIELHKAYIGANRDKFAANLKAAIDILKGSVPREPEVAGAVADAWRALFFVVPVLSTTFASFDRLFAHLGREAIGWLMIDEAGQAAPQAAVGALWRSRRAIVVGDPLQLEPIVPSPYPFQRAVQSCKAFSLEDTWLPGKTSVQRRADTTMDLGTLLAPTLNSKERLWVGAPLRVHRRCDDPMFTISNVIAYGNMMVFGKLRTKQHAIGKLTTGWIDVPFPNGGDSNCNPRDLEVTKYVLEQLSASRAVNLAKEVFLLSPFRDTADELTSLGAEFGMSSKRAGTIHTAQGKEAEIVILALGGSTINARKWAAETPNLLNVAATRAKKILIIIGSRKNWSSLDHFDTASALIHPLSLHDDSHASMSMET